MSELHLTVLDYDDADAQLAELRELGPDVGETEPTVWYVDPETEPTVWYVDPELERLVMAAVAQYNNGGLQPDSTGLAAVAAITTVERWLLERGSWA